MCICGEAQSVWMCMHVRKEERDAYSYSCLSAPVVCSSETSYCLDHAEASATFSNRQKKYINKMINKIQYVWGLSWGVVIQVQCDRSIRSSIPLTSSWSLRKARDRGFSMWNPTDTANWLHALCIQTGQSLCWVANFVPVKKRICCTSKTYETHCIH